MCAFGGALAGQLGHGGDEMIDLTAIADRLQAIEDSIWHMRCQPCPETAALWGVIHDLRAEAARRTAEADKTPAPWEGPY